MTKDKSIFIKNIYYMLSYAFTTLRESVYEDIEKEQFENINSLFAAILAKGIGLQLKQGLYREYIGRTQDLAVVRGKIDMPGTLRNRLQRRMAVTCSYDVLSENNLLNQIIRSTAYLLLRQKDVKEKYKAELKREMMFFSEVDEIDLLHIRWSDIRLHRNNRTYEMLLAICRMLIEGSLLTTESGEYHLAQFKDEQKMCRLYEKFILEYYAQEYGSRLKGFSSRAAQIPWQLDDGYDVLLPVMQTDITLTYGNQTLIIDAKYYDKTLQSNFNVRTIHSGNLYQIFTYVKNKEIELKGTGHQVSGMLLYAKTDEDIVPDNVYHMSGSRISVKTLDLGQPFPEIAGQLNEIVRQYFGIEFPGKSEDRLKEPEEHLEKAAGEVTEEDDAAEPETVADVSSPDVSLAWEEIYDYLVDEETTAFADRARAAGITAPDPDNVGYEVMQKGKGVVATIELAWPDRKIGFMTRDQAADKEKVKVLGWTILTSGMKFTRDDFTGAKE